MYEVRPDLTLVERRVPPLRKRYDLAASPPHWDALLLLTTAPAVPGPDAAAGPGSPAAPGPPAVPELVAAAATTYAAWNRRQVLDELHVAPAHRRRGHARTLIEAVLRIAGANGARELWAETQNVNHPAVQAYRRLGFTLTGLDTTLYGTTETALFLSRPIECSPWAISRAREFLSTPGRPSHDANFRTSPE